MGFLNIKEFYGQCLDVKNSWRVTKLSIDSVNRQVRVRVERVRGVPWADPETRARAPMWLKNHEDLRFQSEAEFRELLAQDLKTGAPWTLKENFDRLRGYGFMAWAVKFLWNWTEAARDSGLTPMAKAADMVERHAEGILNFLWHPICLRLSPPRSGSNAAAEEGSTPSYRAPDTRPAACPISSPSAAAFCFSRQA